LSRLGLVVEAGLMCHFSDDGDSVYLNFFAFSSVFSSILSLSTRPTKLGP